MRYRKYGKTEKMISILGFGGMRLPSDQQEAYSLVRQAIEQGINYFDTAPSYCNWRSEEIIGQAVKDSDKKVYLSDKSMVTYDPKADDLRKRLEISLKNMQAEKFHFYHMWDVSTWEKFENVIKKGGPYEGALRAKEEGLIDHICISTHADGQTVKKMLDTDLFDGVTLGYNLINSEYRRAAIDYAAEKGLGIATMNSLAGGVIPRVKSSIGSLFKEDNLDPIAVAFRFILSTPGVTTALSGISNLRQLEENLKSVEQEINSDQSETERIKLLFNSLGHKFCTYCWYCLPCPKKIPIPQFLSAWNIARLEGQEGARSFIDQNIVNLKNMSGLAKDCIECGQCQDRCTQKLNVISILKDISKEYDEFITSQRTEKDTVKSCR